MWLSIVSRHRMALLSLAVMQVLVACQTVEYGPQGGPERAIYSYSEKRSGEGRYTLKVEAANGENPARMHIMWERRARELCGEGFRKTLFRAERPTVAYQYYGGMPGNMILEGFLECNPDSLEISESGVGPG